MAHLVVVETRWSRDVEVRGRVHRFSWPTWAATSEAGASGTCGPRGPSWYDRSQGRRRWCGAGHGTPSGVLVEAAPQGQLPHQADGANRSLARHGCGHTRSFAAGGMFGHAVLQEGNHELMRTRLAQVASFITRVWADTAAGVDAFRLGLQRESGSMRSLQAPPHVPDRRGRSTTAAGWCGPVPAGNARRTLLR